MKRRSLRTFIDTLLSLYWPWTNWRYAQAMQAAPIFEADA